MDRLNSLIHDIIASCQRIAEYYPSFKDGDGAIRICVIPQGSWRSEQPEYIADNVDRMEFTARINPRGGNYVLNRGRSDAPLVDTYAFSAMKIADLLHEMETSEYFSSRSTKDVKICEDNGFAPYRGAVCFKIYSFDELSTLLIVSVSGGTQDDDESVAKSAISAIANWCDSGPKNECGKPIIKFEI